MPVVIHDLSTLCPEKVIIRIGNGYETDIEDIDLTIVPAEHTIHLTAEINKHGGWATIPDDVMVELVAEICTSVNPKITADWLWSHLTRPQIAGLTKLVLTQAFRPWGNPTKQDAPKDAASSDDIKNR